MKQHLNFVLILLFASVFAVSDNSSALVDVTDDGERNEIHVFIILL